MTKSNKPTQKLTLSPNLFNSLYSVLLFFVATKATVGETQFSQSATKVKEQIDKFGKFIEKENAESNLFLLNYYDREIVQILKLLIVYNSLREIPTADHFTQLALQQKA